MENHAKEPTQCDPPVADRRAGDAPLGAFPDPDRTARRGHIHVDDLPNSGGHLTEVVHCPQCCAANDGACNNRSTSDHDPAPTSYDPSSAPSANPSPDYVFTEPNGYL